MSGGRHTATGFALFPAENGRHDSVRPGNGQSGPDQKVCPIAYFAVLWRASIFAGGVRYNMTRGPLYTLLLGRARTYSTQTKAPRRSRVVGGGVSFCYSAQSGTSQYEHPLYPPLISHRLTHPSHPPLIQLLHRGADTVSDAAFGPRSMSYICTSLIHISYDAASAALLAGQPAH